MKNIYYLYSRIGGSNYPPIRETRTPFRHSFCSGFINKLEMKEIRLNKWGKYKNAYSALVDDDDYEYLSQFQWNAKSTGSNFYAVRAIIINGKQYNLKMHREIMNTPDGMEVDHIDHNGLNNQKNNLRNCTSRQNRLNVLPRGVSSYIGVSRRTGTTKWFAQVKVNKKTLFLGMFDKEDDAARKRDLFAYKYFGEFTRLNFPELKEQYLAELSLSLCNL